MPTRTSWMRLDRRARYGVRCFCRRSFETRTRFRASDGCLPDAPGSGARSGVRRRRRPRRARRRRGGPGRGRAAPTSSPRTVRSARNAPTAWCSATPTSCTGAPSRPATRSQFCVPSSFDISVSAVSRGSTARSSPRSTPSATIAAELLDQVLALGPVAGERLRVAGGEPVDLVEVVGRAHKAATSARMIAVELHRGRSAGGAHPRRRARAAPGWPPPTISSSSSPLLRK